MPKFLAKNPTVDDHMIIIWIGTDNASDLHFVLLLQGVMSFLVGAAMLQAFGNKFVPKYHLAAEGPDCCSRLSSYSSLEDMC